MKVVVNHGNHGVLDSKLILSQARVQVLLQLLAQGLDDDLRVRDLLAVELHEGQKAALGPQLAIVRDILENK